MQGSVRPTSSLRRQTVTLGRSAMVVRRALTNSMSIVMTLVLTRRASMHSVIDHGKRLLGVALPMPSESTSPEIGVPGPQRNAWLSPGTQIIVHSKKMATRAVSAPRSLMQMTLIASRLTSHPSQRHFLHRSQRLVFAPRMTLLLLLIQSLLPSRSLHQNPSLHRSQSLHPIPSLHQTPSPLQSLSHLLNPSQLQSQ